MDPNKNILKGGMVPGDYSRASREAPDEGLVTRQCQIDLDEIIALDLEDFLDVISERAFGSSLLMEVTYSVASASGDTLTLNVTGDPSEIEP